MTIVNLCPRAFTPAFQEHVSKLEHDHAYRNEYIAFVKRIGLTAYYNTEFWKLTLVAKRKFDPSGACYKCKRSKPLQGHHKDANYSHLGIEILYIDDIELLCDACHRDFHGIPDQHQMRFQFPSPRVEPNRSIAEVLAEAVEIEFNRRLPRQSHA